MTPRLCRTFQTAPAAVPRDDSAKYLRSGFESEGFQCPDWLVPDIEDGTAPNMKAEALENTVALVDEYGEAFPGEIWPRVQWAYDDESLREAGRSEISTLAAEAGDGIDGVVVPKVGRVADVERAADAVAAAEADAGLAEGTLGLSVIVESARAVSDLREIARFGADSRLLGLVFGPVDYTAELGGRDVGNGRPDWPTVRSALSNEASANGLVAIGGPFDRLFRTRAGVQAYNADGYADQVEREATVGLDGSWSLHPKQTVQANRIHMPTPAELRQAVDSIEEFEAAAESGTGAVTIDGQMVDEATIKNYENTVAFVAAIRDAHPSQAEDAYEEGLLDRVTDLDRLA
ncbi:L-malyl-CoA/beta-methylmalyl-CoA lyase [Halobacteriales archaeon Cl-PHB]